MDRVRKAMEDRMLRSAVDRAAVWNKAAAKAYARVAVGWAFSLSVRYFFGAKINYSDIFDEIYSSKIFLPGDDFIL